MPRFAANLSMLYPELDFLDRFEAAAKDGFQAVEFLFPYAHPAQALASRLKAHGLQQVLFNMPPGNWDAGERGMASLPGREAEFREGVHKALEYALALDCPRLHVMAGLLPDGVRREDVQPVYVDNLRWAAEQAARVGRDVLIEPINTRDIPHYFLNRQDHAHQIVEMIGMPNLKVQMDLYHCQIVEGDLAMKLRQYLPTGRVGHLQIAGVPDRHEPDLGEIHFGHLFNVIDDIVAAGKWDGWIGCEYRPRRGSVANGTSDGLEWLRSLPASA